MTGEIVAALFGGGVLGTLGKTVVDWLRGRRRDAMQVQESLFQRLERELGRRESRIKKTEDELAQWRARYFELQEVHQQEIVRCRAEAAAMREELASMKIRVMVLEAEVERLLGKGKEVAGADVGGARSGASGEEGAAEDRGVPGPGPGPGAAG